ncbi:hypothetical protein BpHYR1_001325 [Brachionus plicatilis]|uniref:Uncharacterized protein n=1 Tax=Brachionus plicatilis TaxID=10195 RepID=A0A3M7T7M0_BRAPC|nr:hypothetical protein BpHYR1_001325 [Brachionus plicatilis]
MCVVAKCSDVSCWLPMTTRSLAKTSAHLIGQIHDNPNLNKAFAALRLKTRLTDAYFWRAKKI